MRISSFRSNKKFFHFCLDDRDFPRPNNLRWSQLQQHLNEYAKKHEIELHALVMMDTHVHLLGTTSTGGENLFVKALQARLEPHGVTYPAAEPVLNYSQYLNTYRYVYLNPVQAGICPRAEDYPYSSLHALLGKGPALNCPVVDYLGLIQHPQRILRWLHDGGDYKISRLQQTSWSGPAN